MNAFPLAACLLRPVTRALRHTLMTPVLFTVTVTLLFLLVSTPSLPHRHAHKPGSNGSSSGMVESGIRGLSPVNRPSSPHAQERTSDISSSLGGSDHRRFFLTGIPDGRLGNHMFQYASLLGLAALNNRTAFVTSSWSLTLHFAGVSVLHQPGVSSWPVVKERWYARRDPRLESLPRKNLKIRGFLQSWRYFRHVEDKVRAAFRFLPNVQRAADLFYVIQMRHHVGESDVIKVGVHVRRTDMTSDTEQEKGYVSAPLSYLHRAMDHMRTLYGRRVVFFVISDDPEWCRAHLLPRGTRPGHASDQRASDQRASDYGTSDQRASDHGASDHRASDQRASDHGASDQYAPDQADPLLVSAQTQTDPPPFPIGSSHQHHVIVVGPAPSVVHLGFLARCDHVIMTVGTFGWWGAYLSAGHVTYYSGYPRAGSSLAKAFSHSDFYPPSWVALGD